MNRTFTEQTQKQLIKKLHVLLAKARIDKVGKRDILSAYGVAHSNELSCDFLIEICNKLESLMSPHNDTVDVMRKRVMASIGGYLRKSNIESSAVLIKSIACRSTGYKNFNAIPVERLRNVYNTFLNKQKDIDAVAKIDSDVAMERLVRDFSLN